MCTQRGFRVISLPHLPSQGPGTPPESHLWGMVREGALAWMGCGVSRRRGRTEPRPGSAGHRSRVRGQRSPGACSFLHSAPPPFVMLTCFSSPPVPRCDTIFPLPCQKKGRVYDSRVLGQQKDRQESSLTARAACPTHGTPSPHGPVAPPRGPMLSAVRRREPGGRAFLQWRWVVT